MSIEDDMREIARLAPLKRHRLAPDMVDGRRMLSPAAARMVLANLNSCPDKTAAAVTAVTAPAPRESRPGPATERHNPPPMSSFASLAEGYYATRSRTGNNDLDFWRIDKPSSGKWAGYMFVKRIVGGGQGDEMQTFQLSNMQQRLACEAIMDLGAEESRMLFAAEMTRCTDCGRMLTDQASRDAGRGPTCRNKRG